VLVSALTAIIPPRTTFAEQDDVRPRSLALPEDFCPDAFADDCRAAGLAFLDGVAAGWGKRELAEWLAGPYGEITLARPMRAPSPRAMGTVDSGALFMLMRRTRRAVVSAVRDIGEGDWHLVTTAIADGHLEPARSAEGELVWLPANGPRMRLESRVLSLFLVDYLFRPEAYDMEMSWCPACDDITFNGADRACDRCVLPPHSSYVSQLDPDEVVFQTGTGSDLG
jgi:hypothetical protein